MERTYSPGELVTFVDENSVPHRALVTCWFGGEPDGAEGKPWGCNVVYVSVDPQREDTYGRQMERATSVVHKVSQPAGGNYWHWPDES